MHAFTNANIIVMDGRDTLEALKIDLAKPGAVYGWAFLLDYEFTAKLFEEHLTQLPLSLIVNSKMRSVAADLQARFPRFHSWTWSYNRTMHDKTLLFPAQGITWIGTHNLTQGSYWMALNRAVRIESWPMTNELTEQWRRDARVAKCVVTAAGIPLIKEKPSTTRRKRSKS